MATEEKVMTPYDERMALLTITDIFGSELWELTSKRLAWLEGYKAGGDAEVREHSERCESANCPCYKAGLRDQRKV